MANTHPREYYILRLENGEIFAPHTPGTTRDTARPRLFFSRGAADRFCYRSQLKARPEKVIVRIFTPEGEPI